jgi:hypothetical protein
LLALLLLELLPIGCEFVEQMVNDVGLEDFHSHVIGVVLSVAFNFHIKRQDCRVPEKKKKIFVIKKEFRNGIRYVPFSTFAYNEHFADAYLSLGTFHNVRF